MQRGSPPRRDVDSIEHAYTFNEETHLTDFYNRPENTTRQVWSYPVAGAAKFADKDLYILTSRRTFSAAEALAYDMQALKRATIVGEPTGGGRTKTTIYRVIQSPGALHSASRFADRSIP